MSAGTGNGISITRVFDAPRDLVFQAWTTPESFAYWFGGELSVPVERTTMDVRPGGTWSLVMITPDGKELPFHGVYREVVAPERLVFSITDATAPDDENELVTVTFTDAGDKTEMAFHQGGGGLTAKQYEEAKEGWSTFFDRLAERLSA